MGGFSRLIAELKRRKVVQTASVYLVASFVVMQVVDAVFPYLPLPDEDAAGTLVLAILAIGFPVALALSWAFQLTPPSFRREEPQAPRLEATEAPRPKALRSDAVAVLPFENLSGDPENQYFSDGITDDIIASVAHVQGLRVLSRNASGRFRHLGYSVDRIASVLGVATVVNGSVRRSGTRVRVVAEVVDGATNDLLWTQSYDRELEDIFDVQSDIAACVAVAVQRELTKADRKNIALRGTTDATAYELYLRARHLWNQRTEASLERSLRGFERAVERDPEFALAHSALAEAYTILGVYGAMSPTDAYPRARTSAERALSLDPDLGEAMTALACISAVFDWQWADAEEEFNRALELSPSYPTARQWYAMNLLVPQGRFDDGLLQLEQAAELDPGSNAIAVSRGILAFYSRAYGDAVEEFARSLESAPDFALTHFFLGQSRIFMGQPEEGLEALATAVDSSEASSETLAAHGHALALCGRTTEAEGVLGRLEARAGRRYVSPALLAQVQIGLGRPGDAIDGLRDAMMVRSTELIWLGVQPHFDPLRGTEAFAALLGRLGLPGADTPPGRAEGPA